MKLPRPQLPRLLAAFVGLLVASVAAAAPAAAQGQFDRPKYASIVVDANSGEVLYSLRADEPRFPASISKVMTLYLTFEALATGRLKLEDRVPFSPHAAAQAPSKIGVAAGRDISVDDAIQSAAVLSANDSAVALAERISGSEDRFASLMTLRAQELGMSRTRFVNANGLPDSRQVSTARDLAILSRAVMRDYPQYYRYFNQRAFSWGGRTTLNHNRLLLRMVGMDGLKTGYTNAAGFNLAASAVRDGRRLITVVLGGSSSAARNENVENLLTAGFEVLNRRARGERITLASAMNEPDDMTGPLLRPPVEMGSADQGGLQVVLGRPVPNPPEAAPVRLARADLPAATAAAITLRPAVLKVGDTCETVTVRRHGRRAHERRCHATPATLAANAAPDCRRMRGAKLHACRSEARQVARADRSAGEADCRGLKGRKLKACHARSEPVQVAKAEAEDCAGKHGRKLKGCRKAAAVEAPAAVAAAQLRDCSKPKGRHARAACRAGAEGATETASAGGGYLVQVGAFGSRADAKAHLAKLARTHSALFGGALEAVESGGKGYRARFAGLSQTEAKAACKRLSAHGERCLVMAR